MIVFDGVSYAYPFQERQAVRDVNLRVRAGEAVLITGASGCGKSTLVRLLNGLCPHFFRGNLQGRVLIAGQDNADRRLDDISGDVGSLFQDPEHQFFALTVEDEIAFVHEWRENTPEAVREKVDLAAERFGLGPVMRQSIHNLSEGQKQKVALAGAMSLDPRILVLDEPTANLDPESTLDLAQKILALKRAGMAVVIVDHRLYWLESVVDRVCVMSGGEIAAEGDFSLLADPDLRRKFGLRRAEVRDVRPGMQTAEGRAPVVRVEDLHFGYGKGADLFDGVSFSLPAGVTGLLGENGAGKTTLARLLTGLSKFRSGRLFIGEEAVTPRQLLERASIVLQNTDHQLYMKTVAEEIRLSTGLSRKKGGGPDVPALLRRFGLEDKADRHPQSLSGGEKQRLVIACALVKQPEILILDEPTSGLDGKNMAVIAGGIHEAAQNGACVLLISHDLELLGAACETALRLPIS